MNSSRTELWKALSEYRNALPPLKQLLLDADRQQKLTLQLGDCLFDFSKQRIDDNVLAHFSALSDQSNILTQRDALFAGAPINTSENRSVLHMALRDGAPDVTADIQQDVRDVRARMTQLCTDLYAGRWLGYSGKRITDVVHIGIGGSHLGPELVEGALADHRTGRLRLHFAANIDAEALLSIFAERTLNPETTLFVIASKSFNTLETLYNAQTARSWFLERTSDVTAIAQHFVAVTNNIQAAAEFGLPQANLLPMWDWVGGRFSVWSAVGLPVLLSIGPDNFERFLAGAQAADKHFRETDDIALNIPLLAAMCALWNINVLGAQSLVTLSYDERLALLPSFLQQLEMESNGKRVNQTNQPIDYATMPTLWGGTGTQGQHAYHQQLHQGTTEYAADFILVADREHDIAEHRHWLLANGLAQSQAMALGRETEEAFRQVPGNRANTTIVMNTLSPEAMGTLLAVYEHKVFCLGVLWDINSFDQWGVELGKDLAPPIYNALTSDLTDTGPEQDASTTALIAHIKQKRQR